MYCLNKPRAGVYLYLSHHFNGGYCKVPCFLHVNEHFIMGIIVQF